MAKELLWQQKVEIWYSKYKNTIIQEIKRNKQLIQKSFHLSIFFANEVSSSAQARELSLIKILKNFIFFIVL